MVYYDMYFILVNIDEDQMNWTCKFYVQGRNKNQHLGKYNCSCNDKKSHYLLQCRVDNYIYNIQIS